MPTPLGVGQLHREIGDEVSDRSVEWTQGGSPQPSLHLPPPEPRRPPQPEKVTLQTVGRMNSATANTECHLGLLPWENTINHSPRYTHVKEAGLD